MDEVEKNSIENLDLEKEGSLEQLRKAALHWKKRHDRVLALAEEALQKITHPVNTDELPDHWTRNLKQP